MFSIFLVNLLYVIILILASCRIKFTYKINNSYS